MIKCMSLFSQILSEMSLYSVSFEQLVMKHGNDRNAKGFTSKAQLVAMIFSHLARADSLREITNGLLCCNGKVKHLGIKAAPKRSTLAYANEHRNADLYEEYFWKQLQHFRSRNMLEKSGKKFKFKNKLFLFDSTTISLCLSLFPWADYRQTKGGVKVHVLLDQSDYMPSFITITDAKIHDSAVSKTLNLKPGSIIAADRGYLDFEQFSRWNKSKIFFVTRMKDNICYKTVIHGCGAYGSNVRSDDEIILTGINTKIKYPKKLRLVTVWNEEKQEEIKILTNNFKLAASTIGAIYKERWEIELFFKTLKQTLNVKTFIGTSENALRIQIWTAMISLLIIRWLHHLSKMKWSFSVMSAMLRLNLFTYRPLPEWLDRPYETPPAVPVPEQQLIFN